MVEFRYKSPGEEFRHAEASTGGIAIGFQQAAGLANGIDLFDGINGGPSNPLSGITLDPADIDEQVPVEQLNILLPLNGYLLPYGY